MTDMNASNVFQIIIFQVLKFMCKAKHNLNPRAFDNTFTEIHHRYSSRFSRSNLNYQKKLPKPLVLQILLVGQKFGTITYRNLKRIIFSLPLFFKKLKK